MRFYPRRRSRPAMVAAAFAAALIVAGWALGFAGSVGFPRAQCTVAAAAAEREYINREHGFAFRYPADWQRQSDSALISLREPGSTGFPASVNAALERRAGVSARQYAEASAQTVSSGLVRGLGDFRPEGAGAPGALPGTDSWVIRFSCYSSELRERVYFHQLTVVRGEHVIVLTAACLNSRRAQSASVLDRVISSFRLM